MTKTLMSVFHSADWSNQEPHIERIEWGGTISLQTLVNFLKYDLAWHPQVLLAHITLRVAE